VLLSELTANRFRGFVAAKGTCLSTNLSFRIQFILVNIRIFISQQLCDILKMIILAQIKFHDRPCTANKHWWLCYRKFSVLEKKNWV